MFLDVAGSLEESSDGGASQGGRPPGFKLPQIVVEGIRRHSRHTDVITFHLKVLRVIELRFLVCIPPAGRTKAPVYVRFFLDKDAGDPPGSVVIE